MFDKLIGVFLQGAAEFDPAAFGTGDAGMFAALLGLFLGVLIVFAILAVAIYVYTSLAFMGISKKTGVGPAGIAWIPFIGKPLLSAKISKMHWWPVLLILLPFVLGWIPIVGPVVGSLGGLVFMVFWFIWGWKVFEAVSKPGWWILLAFIPLVYFILLGIAAWGSSSDAQTSSI